MYPVSSDFKAAVRQPHQMTIRAEVWRSGVFLRDLEVIEGTVDIDSRRAQRRTCTVRVPATRPTVSLEPVFLTYAEIRPGASHGYATYADLAAAYANYGALRQITGYTEVTVDDGLIPDSAFSDVAPFGNELRLWRGIRMEKSVQWTYATLAAGG